MYEGKYTQERRRRPALWAALALALVLTLSVGGTVAYLFMGTQSITNTFNPAQTSIKVVETFANNKKSSITVENESNIDVYIRVMLVANYQNDNGNVCGTHTAAQPEFTPGSDWVKGGDGYYYYTKAVAAGQSTGELLGNNSSIQLDTDADDCKMHVDVLAQCIQAEPSNAVQEAWGVTISNGSVTKSTTN